MNADNGIEPPESESNSGQDSSGAVEARSLPKIRNSNITLRRAKTNVPGTALPNKK